jgi:hypothetical protein
MGESQRRAAEKGGSTNQKSNLDIPGHNGVSKIAVGDK